MSGLGKFPVQLCNSACNPGRIRTIVSRPKSSTGLVGLITSYNVQRVISCIGYTHLQKLKLNSANQCILCTIGQTAIQTTLYWNIGLTFSVVLVNAKRPVYIWKSRLLNVRSILLDVYMYVPPGEGPENLQRFYRKKFGFDGFTTCKYLYLHPTKKLRPVPKCLSQSNGMRHMSTRHEHIIFTARRSSASAVGNRNSVLRPSVYLSVSPSHARLYNDWIKWY